MAIVINGSGTVTGLAVGGLPDGTVDAGTLATDSVTAAKLEVSAITGADLPAGSVLQVVQGTTDTETINTTTTFANTTLTATITPSATSSKILVILTQGIWIERSGGESIAAWINLMRDTTQINQRYYELEAGLNNENDRALAVTHAENFLDTPSTASAVTYKTQVKLGLSTASPQVATQKGGTNYHSKITLLEIAG